jgi:hypothetical protein
VTSTGTRLVATVAVAPTATVAAVAAICVRGTAAIVVAVAVARAVVVAVVIVAVDVGDHLAQRADLATQRPGLVAEPLGDRPRCALPGQQAPCRTPGAQHLPCLLVDPAATTCGRLG